MTSHVTFAFRRQYAALRPDIRRRADEAFHRFQRDPAQHGLFFKLVLPKYHIWSARVSDDYRVLGQRDGDVIWWFWIGRHADYDKLLRRL